MVYQINNFKFDTTKLDQAKVKYTLNKKIYVGIISTEIYPIHINLYAIYLEHDYISKLKVMCVSKFIVLY